MAYTIYRLKHTDAADLRRYRGSAWHREKGLNIDRDLYEPIYTSEGLADLEHIFLLFRSDKRPAAMEKMNVSDVVELDGVFWFCDNVGWLELTEWRAEKSWRCTYEHPTTGQIVTAIVRAVTFEEAEVKGWQNAAGWTLTKVEEV